MRKLIVIVLQYFLWDLPLATAANSTSISANNSSLMPNAAESSAHNRDLLRRKYHLNDAGFTFFNAYYFFAKPEAVAEKYGSVVPILLPSTSNLPERAFFIKHLTDFEEISIAPTYRQAFAKQIGLPDNPWSFLVNRVPCDCRNGVCGCCTGMIIPAWRSIGCMNITYVPEDFAFEFKMIMNDAVLYENRLTGRNPPPVCVRPPRFGFIRVCAEFHDLYFVGRNMHVCLDMTASFQDYELFNRSFNCMRLGDKGVKIVRPEDGGGFHKPGVDADIDAGYDPIEEYDENVG